MASRPSAPPQVPSASHVSGAAAAESTRESQAEDGNDDNDDDDDDDDEVSATAELPLTMSASVVLAELPRDAAAALASAGDALFGHEATATVTGGAGRCRQAEAKVVVRFKPVGAAPALGQDVCKITATRRFEEVVRYLRRKLACKPSDSVFLYVNSAFAPSLGEVVGNLHQCFKNAHDQLVVAYSMTPAFG